MNEQETISAWDVRSLIEASRLKEHQNDLVAALSLAIDAEEAYTKCSEKSDELKADLLQHLSQIHRRRQDFEKLDTCSRDLLDIARHIKDEALEATALLNLGIVRSIESDYRSAMTHFVESLAQSERVGFRSNVAHCLINIGNVYANLFNYEDAFDRYNKALTNYADVLNENTRIAVNLNIGNLCYGTEQYTLANDYFEKSLELANETEKSDMVAHAHTLICRALLADKRSIEASRHIEFGATNSPVHLLNVAEIHFLEGNTEEATQHIVNGLEAAKMAKDDASELRGFRLLADVYEKIGDFNRAFRAEKVYSTKQIDYLRMQRAMHTLDLEIRFSLREKQQRIEELTKENSFQGMLLEKSDQIAQQNTQLKQANEELEQFAFITSHDLKEPLRMIGSFSQVIQRQCSGKIDSDTSTYFRHINEGVTRMNALLDALLQYATIGQTEDEMDMVDIASVMLIVKNNLHVKIEETFGNVMCGELPKLRSVQPLLVQLFQNLIGNALKFSRPDSRPIVLINAEEKRDHWLFSVEDNGIGIDKEHCERIFVIFQRLHKRDKYEGTGIGLSICQKIVHQLNGKIWVESEPMKGATFFFTLPK
ncbi:MAG: ATP-binding protein [Saprospiraceae bacterium]|nr:ATP-binding protein [Saprospiraceae bacterium]